MVFTNILHLHTVNVWFTCMQTCQCYIQCVFTVLNFICTCTYSWLVKSPQNVVRLQCSMFGYEHIYMGVARKFNMKVLYL